MEKNLIDCIYRECVQREKFLIAVVDVEFLKKAIRKEFPQLVSQMSAPELVKHCLMVISKDSRFEQWGTISTPLYGETKAEYPIYRRKILNED